MVDFSYFDVCMSEMACKIDANQLKKLANTIAKVCATMSFQLNVSELPISAILDFEFVDLRNW